MRVLMSVCVAVFCWAEVLVVDVPAPEFTISNDKLFVKNAGYLDVPGAPRLPCTRKTIALPLGAVCESVEFSGVWQEFGECVIQPAEPLLPLMQDAKIVSKSMQMYENTKNRIYSSNTLYPQDFGRLIAKGGLRKYSLVDVACHHFAYEPMSNLLFYTPTITVTIHYRMPQPDSERAQFWAQMQNDITADKYAGQLIHNWDQAQTWYATDTPYRANGYYIIIPAATQSAVADLVAWRTSQGYDVNIVTSEYIFANVPGADSCQQVRNYLRAHMTDIKYVLLVGTMYHIPFRSVVPFNNDPDSPHNDPGISPVPTDLYYAELTDHDTLSWNSDRDAYYGEVYNQDMEPYGDDNVDYHADVHLGRIPFTTGSNIQEICQKIIRFDSIVDDSYKTAALLPGGLIYFENENHSTYPWIDGADNMELFMNDSIVDRSNCIYLYEQAGLRASPHPCTDSLCRSNQKSYWNSKGIMYEYNHGAPTGYARKIWTWDDGDSIAESPEIEFPWLLENADVFDLDNNHPATTYLLSCWTGRPEEDGLAKYLLYRGSSSVICATRIGWVPRHDSALGHFYFSRLMKDTTASHGIIGDAYDLGRNDHMEASGFWMNTYIFNQYGDPATRQFGRLVGMDNIPPSAPAIYAEKAGSNITLTWNAVTTDTSGSTETMDCYVVYRNTAPDFVPGPSDSIGMTTHPDTEYVDSGVLADTLDYYYLVMAVDAASNKSTKSNMAYVFCKNVNENSTATDKNWVSLPWYSNYATVSDLTDDVSPSGDPLVKITNLRDDQLFDSWLWDDLFLEWTGTDFGIESGHGYEIVTTYDTYVVWAGANDIRGEISLNENPSTTDKNWVSIPYNAVYTTTSDITDEYSPGGDPLIKLTNLRDDQWFESWLYDDVFMEWSGTDFAIEDGRGYELVTTTDTTWDPTEFANTGSKDVLFHREKNTGMRTYVGESTESDRTPVWRIAHGQWHIAHGKEQSAKGIEPKSKISHVVRVHLKTSGCENLVFTAYRPTLPHDVLTEAMVGCGYAANDEITALWFDVGNFAVAWQDAEEVMVLVEATQDGQGWYAVTSFMLDKDTDIQDLASIELKQILPTVHNGTVSIEDIVSEHVIGFSVYENDHRLNDAIITSDYAMGMTEPCIRLVLVGGYETVYSTHGMQGDDEQIPFNFAFSIVPNPFITQTHIDYALPRESRVLITMYDVSGRHVRTLVSGMHQPGYYRETWNGVDDQSRQLASGIYFVTFKTETYTAQDKILLLR